MRVIDKYLNDTAKISLLIGGAGKGGSITGLKKFKRFIEEGKDCCLIIRNIKDIKQIIPTIKEVYPEAKIKHSFVYFDNGASILLSDLKGVRGKSFDAIFVDCLNQFDESFQLDDFKFTGKPYIWFNSNSTKCRGFVFELVKPLLIDVGEAYVFPPENIGKIVDGVVVYHATVHENYEFLELYPDYITQLLSLPKTLKMNLLYGYYCKDPHGLIREC